MGQSQSNQPQTHHPIQGYRSMGKIPMRTLSAQVGLYQRGEEVLAHTTYPLESKSLELLLDNNRYYTERASICHSHLLDLHGADFIDTESGVSVRQSMRMGKLTNFNSEQSKKANVNTVCSLNLFQQHCKKNVGGSSQSLNIKLQLYHEFEAHTLETEVEMRKRRDEPFREKELWLLMSNCVSAGKALLNAGLKEPLLSPNSIKIDSRGSYKVGEWQFTHFYEEPEEQQEETYFYEEGETFLRPQSSRIQCENSKLHRKKGYNVLTSYYWAPQGTSGMQDIITIGRKQQSQIKKIGNNQIFSLGMTVLHLLLMRPLYQSQTFSEKRINSYIKQAVVRRTSQGLDISRFLLNVLERMLVWDAEDRICYQQLDNQISSQRSTHTAFSVLTTEHDEAISGTFRDQKINSSKSLIYNEGKGSGSVSQGEGDMEHPLQESRKINLPNTIRGQNFNYEKVDVTIKRQRKEWQKFQNRIQESSYKVKPTTPCRQLFPPPPVSVFSFPAQVLIDDEEDTPNSESLCSFNPNLITQKEKIDFEFSEDVGTNSVDSIKLLDISNIKVYDDTKEVSKNKTSFIKFDVPDEEESFGNFFNENKKKSQTIKEDSLLLKSSVTPPAIQIVQSEKQEDLFTPPELLALIRSSAFSAQSRITNKSARQSNSQFLEQPLIVSKDLQAELCNSVFVKQSFAKGYYQGGKVDGQRSGYGTFYYNEGGKYCGDWQNNQMHGKGTLYYADGRIAYQGDWSHDSLCGKGILYNQNPIKLTNTYDYTCFDQSEQCWVYYEGSFHNDDKWGKGVLLLSNGQKYEGNFKNDLIDGRGIFYTLGGQRIIGQWQANKLVKVIKQEPNQRDNQYSYQ